MHIVLFVLGLYHGANGLVMLGLTDFWYGTVPGVTATGPANGHFIRDIGLIVVPSFLPLAALRRAV